MTQLVGKVVANNVYVIPEHFGTLPSGYPELIKKAVALSAGDPPDYNVLKISPKTSQVSFLYYEGLAENPFPVLKHSTAVNVERDTISTQSYRSRDNPPILHRKELLFGEAHPEYETYALLTRTLEGLGLFGETSRIGHQTEWQALLESVGIILVGHQVVRSAEISPDEEIARHRTALVRSSLSSPIKAALKYDLLTKERDLFDYGCGRGDDLALLTADGFDAVGWDPYYAPEGEKRKSRVVNLGFVLNVIENPSERVSILQDAYSYAEEVLLVAALIDGQKSRSQANRYRDGIITKRGTFQKFFTQMELREFIESSLRTDAVPAGPGLFLVIRSDIQREGFLRTRHTRSGKQTLPRISARAKQTIELNSEEDQVLAEAYWKISCELGRLPRPTELPPTVSEWTIRKFRTLKRASAWLLDHFGEDQLQHAMWRKRNQLIGYLALAVFRGKKIRSLLTPELRREIKSIFGSVRDAETEAHQALRNIANTESLANDCMEACDNGLGVIDTKGRLLVQAERVKELSSSLQVIVGIAEWLGDDLSSVDIVSVLAERANVTFQRYKDFVNEPFPTLEARLRVDLIRQSVQYLPELDADLSRHFLGKSLLLNHVEEDLALLEAEVRRLEPTEFSKHKMNLVFLLEIIGLTGKSWPGVEIGSFVDSLTTGQNKLSGFTGKVTPHSVLPSLDAYCGRFLTFRNLVECGETHANSEVPNLPKQPESYGALRELALKVLDPVIEEYGMIELTYGFSSPELSRKIPSRIAPKIDQHAAHEINRLGNLICSRMGAAVDFYVEHESMLEVAQWIVKNCEFDRLYFYGDARPIHVSVGPDKNQAVVVMKTRSDSREGPINISTEKFLEDII
jgi:DNA phosphorothioation-associated putative methyltransferase